MSKRILIVDDEPDICEILRFNLEMEGYDVEVAESPNLLPRGGERLPDLILLDVMMTPKSGFEWAKELKSNPSTANIPIIFCTAKTLEEDLLQGFALGSDDYICKPFRISEVKARVKAVLKRATPYEPSPDKTPSWPSQGEEMEVTITSDNRHSSNIIVYKEVSPRGDLEGVGIVLDLDRKECFIDGQEVVFTKLEFEVFALLLSKPGQVFSREKILSTVWPSDTIVLDRTVDVNITRIRKKIGRYGEYLRTKFGYGYKFG